MSSEFCSRIQEKWSVFTVFHRTFPYRILQTWGLPVAVINPSKSPVPSSISLKQRLSDLAFKYHFGGTSGTLSRCSLNKDIIQHRLDTEEMSSHTWPHSTEVTLLQNK